MKTYYKKTLIAASVAAALGGPATALAIPGITFDVNGSALGGEKVGVTRFNWTNQAVRAEGLFDEVVGNSLTGFLKGHGQLDTYTFGNMGFTLPAGVITYQYSVEVSAALNDTKGGAGDKVTFSDTANYGATNFFNLYFDPTSNISLTSGEGFGKAGGEVNADQFLILSGKISLSTLLGSTFTAQGSTTDPSVPLDSATPDLLGPWAIGGSGSVNLDIDVCQPSEAGVGKCSAFAAATGDTIDTDWFKSDVSSLSLDVNLNSGIQSFFDQFRPPAKILNVAVLGANLGALEAVAAAGGAMRYGNDFDCGGAAGACDMLYQGQNGLSRWNHTTIPEPTTLALLGLAAGAFGFSARRRQQKQDV